MSIVGDVRRSLTGLVAYVEAGHVAEEDPGDGEAASAYRVVQSRVAVIVGVVYVAAVLQKALRHGHVALARGIMERSAAIALKGNTHAHRGRVCWRVSREKKRGA